MWIRLLILATPFLINACAAPAPLAVVGAGAYEVAKYEENLRLRAAAALHDAAKPAHVFDQSNCTRQYRKSGRDVSTRL